MGVGVFGVDNNKDFVVRELETFKEVGVVETETHINKDSETV